MKTLIRYLRADEWMSSKVTMMLGTAAYFLCINGRDMLTACRELAVYFLFLAMFLAISYVSNDFSDLEIDKKAGKKKVIAQLPRWVISLIVSLCCYHTDPLSGCQPAYKSRSFYRTIV